MLKTTVLTNKQQTPRHIRLTRDQVLIAHLNYASECVNESLVKSTLPTTKLMGISKAVHRMLAYSSDILAETCDVPFLKLEAQLQINVKGQC